MIRTKPSSLAATGWWRVPAALFAAVLTLYLAFPTKDLYWDGAGFALVLDHPGWYPMIEANHPIYIGFGWLVHSLVLPIVPAVRGLAVLQALNSVLGALSVVMVYGIAAEFFADRFDAVLLAGMFAFSATWWKFATDSNAYIPSVLLLLVAAWLLLPGRSARPVLVALVHTLAMLFHELAVMFFVAAAVGIYVQSRGDRRGAARNVAVYLSTALVLSSAAYYACFHLATGQTAAAGYLRWITWHTPDSTSSLAVARNAWWTIRGTARLAVGGRPGAFHSGLAEMGVLLALWGVGLVLVLRTAPARSGETDLAASRGAAAFLWTWVTVYVGFLFFWLPQNTFYRLFYLPPLVLLAGAALRKWRGRRALYAVVGLLGGWNYLFYIHPNSLIETNAVVRAAVAMQPLWKPGTRIYQGSFNTDNWIVFCFNPQVMFQNVDLAKLAETTVDLKGFEEAGHEVWLDQSGIDLLASDPGGNRWLTEHTRPGFKRDFSDGKHRVSFDRLFP
jgi:hypothetical protein